MNGTGYYTTERCIECGEGVTMMCQQGTGFCSQNCADHAAEIKRMVLAIDWGHSR